MKFAAAILSGILASAAWAAEIPELTQIKSVYLLPMRNGFEQYIANRIANRGLFQVVTDPKRADAVFTDRVGSALDAQLDEFVPEPAPAGEPKAAEPKKDEAKKEEARAAEAPAMGDIKATGAAAPASSFSRSKGTLFLVDVRSRRVLWSTYERPKDATPGQLDRTAGRVASKLEQALTPKKK